MTLKLCSISNNHSHNVHEFCWERFLIGFVSVMYVVCVALTHKSRTAGVRLKDDGPTGQTTGQWGDPSSATSSGPSFKIWLKETGWTTG